MQLNGLYAITEDHGASSAALLQKIESALLGGAKIVQYRNKSTDTKKRLNEAMQLRKLCDRFKAALIINDDIELAASCCADGVHLGKHDASIDQARTLLGGNSIIGISCYNRFEYALAAQKQGANYIAFGSFFPSQTKPNAIKADINLLKQAKRELIIPICAIGGITFENAKPLIDAGADMLAVISHIFQQANIQQASHNIASLFRAHRS